MKEKILFYVTVFWYLIGYYLILPKDSPFECYYFIWEKSSSLLWITCYVKKVKYDWLILVPIILLMTLRIVLEIPTMANYDLINNKWFLNILSLVIIFCILAAIHLSIKDDIKLKQAKKDYYEAINLEYIEKTKEKIDKGEIINDTKPYKF